MWLGLFLLAPFRSHYFKYHFIGWPHTISPDGSEVVDALVHAVFYDALA